MKKIYLLLAIAILGTTATAQETGAAARFGIKVAPNLSWTRPDTRGLQGEGSRLGYSVGLMAEFPIGITENYRFATGLFLTNIGGRTSYGYNTTDTIFGERSFAVHDTWRLRYVEVPLTIKMTTNEIGYLRYYGQLGVSAGINLRARADQEVIISSGGQTTSVMEDDLEVQDGINAFRAALVIGGGVEYNFSGQTTLLVGITYYNGIVNMLSDPLPGLDNTSPKLFADHLELTLGIFF